MGFATRVSRIASACIVGIGIGGIGGCAVNPLVRWVPPEPPTNRTAMTLDHGRQFTAGARAAYQKKIYEQVDTLTNLSSGIITLGGAIAAMAAFKAHKDAIVGSALIGGTALTLGQWNLDKRRLIVYQAAVAAFNCAERAVSPLDMSEATLKELTTRTTQLTVDMGAATGAIGELELALAGWTPKTPEATAAQTRFQAAIVAARHVLQAAGTTRESGDALEERARNASNALIQAVRNIEQQADKVLPDTMGDLNQLPTIIGMLRQGAAQIATNAGVEAGMLTALTRSVDPAAPDAGAGGGDQQSRKARAEAEAVPAGVKSASSRMTAAMRKVALSAAHVQSLVGSYANAMQSDTLADCGIGAISFAMSAEPPTAVEMPGTAASIPVVIQGGKPPFSVRPSGASVTGVTVEGPDRMGREFTVKIAADAPGGKTARFLIRDSSDPTRTLPYVVEIGPASTPADKPDNQNRPANKPKVKPAAKPAVKPDVPEGTTPPQANTNPTASADGLGWLRRVKDVKVGDVIVSQSMDPLAASGGGYAISVSCKAPPPALCLPHDMVRDAYLGAVKAAGGTLQGALRIRNTPPDRCVCAQ